MANLLPFNIDLLALSDQDIKMIRPVKVLDIFDGFSKNFHPDGLFSVETFGKVGEEKRNRMYSYIDMRLAIFHPVIFKALGDLKSLYTEIIAGKSYATFDKATSDFVKVNAVDGNTGYSFFLKHFADLKFEKRPSSSREFNIRLVDKYRSKAMLDKLVVMPAGLRDFVIDQNGKPSEDEINTLYRKVLSVSGVVENVNAKLNAEYLDAARYNLQLAVSAIYDYIRNLLEGKSRLILGKWASRNIDNSTRNVITSYIPNTDELHSANTVNANQTVVGMYQYLRSILPLAVKNTRDTYLSNVFVGPNSPAMLVNKKTLKKEMVQMDPNDYDDWMTYEGLEKVMAKFGEEDLRHEALEIGDHYLALMYKGPDGTFRFCQGIDDMPEGRDPKDMHPITFAELLYISNFKGSSQTPGFVTRYPITGYGSIYPCYAYLKTTVKADKRTELNEAWELTDNVAFEFPRDGEQFYNSMSPAVAHLARLTADFDGDTCSWTALLTEDAKIDFKRVLNSRDYYVGINGKMSFAAGNDIIDLVLITITG